MGGAKFFATKYAPNYYFAATHILYNGAYFGYRALELYQNPTQITNEIFQDALIDTTKVAFFGVVLEGVNRGLERATTYCQTNGYGKSAKALRVINGVGKFGIFAISAAKQGVIETATTVATGALTECAIALLQNNLIQGKPKAKMS